jgi:hypothetical protein
MNIKLSVPYYSQRDNVSEPERSCNKSSCCMVAEYIKPGIFGGSDNVYSILPREAGLKPRRSRRIILC